MTMYQTSNKVQSVTELVNNDLCPSSVCTKKQCVINRLCNPRPVKPFIAIASTLVKADNG